MVEITMQIDLLIESMIIIKHDADADRIEVLIESTRGAARLG